MAGSGIGGAGAQDSEVPSRSPPRALDAAVECAKDCIQVLGGIGFTWEHDAHIYLRRALTLRQLYGPTSRWRARVADLTAAGGAASSRSSSPRTPRTTASPPAPRSRPSKTGAC